MADILVVEDDDQVAVTLLRLLAQTGHECHHARTVDEAHAVIAAVDLDVVICDVNLPDRSGLELVQAIAIELPDTAVFMVSGVDDPEVALEALALGATAYVVKPFLRGEILINVNNSLRLRDLARDARARSEEIETKLFERSRMLHEAITRLDDVGRELATARQELVERLTAALSLRNDETTAHVERVSLYAAHLATVRGLDDDAVASLRLAAMLHDVGKIGVPDAVLLKPGPLNEGERKTMMRHAEFGHRLLASGTSTMLRLGAMIAVTHHEHWDGGGYPGRLAGEDIPIEGRITALADSFDALTSDRVYRPAFSVDEAVDTILGGRGTRFDPALVDALVTSLDDLRGIRAEHPDPHVEQVVRVLVIDDHRMFAESLVRLLTSEPGLHVVSVAGSVAEGVAAARDENPDLILLDWELPDGDGAVAARAILAERPQARILLLTGRSDESVLLDAIRAGCAGYVTKHQTAERLIDVVRSTAAGETVVSVSMLKSALARLQNEEMGSRLALTAREIEILRLIADGLSTDAVATRLVVSVNTVRNHVQNILGKLGAHSRLEAVAIAAKRGLLPTPGRSS